MLLVFKGKHVCTAKSTNPWCSRQDSTFGNSSPWIWLIHFYLGKKKSVKSQTNLTERTSECQRGKLPMKEWGFLSFYVKIRLELEASRPSLRKIGDEWVGEIGEGNVGKMDGLGQTEGWKWKEEDGGLRRIKQDGMCDVWKSGEKEERGETIWLK